ncbi:MAG: hypothetical protein GY861_17870 [bacterium]|nr:hypothetical protein [bacterium]
MFGEGKKEKVVGDLPKAKKLIAKKDFVISHNGDRFEIKEGEEVKVPKKYLQNLKTEGVI